MQRAKYLLLAFTFLLSSSFLSAYKNCECGTHQDGITAFSVSGDSCCSSDPGANGTIHTYEWNDGIWELIDTKVITGAAAQAGCCNPSDGVGGGTGGGDIGPDPNDPL